MKNLVMAICIFAFTESAFACFNIAVTKGASSNGSVMLAMTDDAYDRDFRLVRIPGFDHKNGEKSPVYPDMKVFPRFNIKDSSKYYYVPGYELTQPNGFIDEVLHTYAYFDGIYPMMNEHQLAMAESSCGSKASPALDKSKRILEIKDLMRIGLKRCTGAKETVKLFGELVKKHGYYGGGENVIIADTQEIWVFEIAGTPSGDSVWVAQRVPDGEVHVNSNMYTIRDVLTDSPDFMYSDNLFSECKKAGWYDPEKDKTFDWLKTVSNGEYGHPYYSLRRDWRGYCLFAPSRNFKPWVEDTYTREYPFSVKPDSKIGVPEIQKCLRDLLQGTEFDLTKGVAAGPFGNPNRYEGNNTKIKGDWERSISVFRCAYSYITQSRGDMPDVVGGVMWFGCASPHATCYVPFYCGVSDIPEAYQIGDNRHLDRNCAWWAFNYVSNVLDIKFSYMYPEVCKMQDRYEGKELRMQPIVEHTAVAAYAQNPNLAVEYLTDYCNANAETVFKAWWGLGDSLIAKYQNGFIVDGKSFTSPGYSEDWLKAVNFKPIKYQKDPESGKTAKALETDKAEH